VVGVDVGELDVDQQEDLEGGLGIREGRTPAAPAPLSHAAVLGDAGDRAGDAPAAGRRAAAARGSLGISSAEIPGALSKRGPGLASGFLPALEPGRRRPELTWSFVLPSRSLMCVVTILSVSSRNLG